MSDSGPPGHDPFGEIPFIGELMRIMQGQGGSSHDVPRQIAHGIANEGQSESNVDPSDRMAVEELVRVAQLQVASATGLELERSGPIKVAVVNRSQWADQTIDDYRPLFDALSGSLSAGFELPPDMPTDDPMASMIQGFAKMMAPMMSSMTTGTMVGNLARRTLGGYDLPVPRPAGQPLLIALPNVDGFGTEWSLQREDLRLWVCLHEVAHHAVMSVPHVRERITDLLSRHAAGFSSDPENIEAKLGGFDLSQGPEALADLQSILGDPETILGAVRSAEQEALQPELSALVAAITGYVDHIMDNIGTSLIGSYPMLTEALRRRRVEADKADRFVERILGLELDRSQYERGAAFAAGVVERSGEDGLTRLFDRAENLPTSSEVDAPGLWLARIDLPG